MRVSKQSLIFGLLLVSLVLLGAACQKTATNPTNQQANQNSAQNQNIGQGAISVTDKVGVAAATGKSVQITSVVLTKSSFVVIHELSEGRPGTIIGNSVLLPAGETKNFVITLAAALKPGNVYFAMLHVDNGDGIFAASADAPLTNTAGEIIMARFTALPGTAQNNQTSNTLGIKEFNLEAKKFAFIPSIITVNQGDKVRLTITSIDVGHGLYLPDYNIKVDLAPNQPQMVEFTADKKGEFPFFCQVYCGAGHSDMKGKLIVK